MQIPYDLEFVENRSPVAVHAVALREPYSGWPPHRHSTQPDAFDVLLQWAFRLLRRLEAGHQTHHRK